jgi:hypothetical protein
MRDTAFKHVLKSAPLGMPVKIDGPDGIMVFHEDPQRPAMPPGNGCRTGSMSSTRIAGPRMRLSWTSFRNWRRSIQTIT